MSDKDIEITTQIGTIKIRVTGENTIFARLDGTVVRNIPYRGTAYLKDYKGDGCFCLDRGQYVDNPNSGIHNGLYLHRTDKFLVDASRSAKEKFRDVLEADITQWAHSHKELFVSAQKKNDLNLADSMDIGARKLEEQADRMRSVATKLRLKWEASATSDKQKGFDDQIAILKEEIEKNGRNL